MQLNTYKDDAADFQTWVAVVMPKIKQRDAQGEKTLLVPFLPMDAELILIKKGFVVTRLASEILISWI